ncbi:MAG: hypothetical protein ACYDBV_14795, partial [Nitrospiria bacterium]
MSNFTHYNQYENPFSFDNQRVMWAAALNLSNGGYVNNTGVSPDFTPSPVGFTGSTGVPSNSASFFPQSYAAGTTNLTTQTGNPVTGYNA